MVLQEQEVNARSNRTLLSEYPERNLVALVGDLAQRCAELCCEAAGATTRHARVARSWADGKDKGEGGPREEARWTGAGSAPRERTVYGREGVSVYMHFMIVLMFEAIESGI